MKSDDVLKKMIIDMEKIRYNEGYRNWGNKWRSTLKLDTTHGKRVLDYGCGSGIEALQYAKTGIMFTLLISMQVIFHLQKKY